MSTKQHSRTIARRPKIRVVRCNSRCVDTVRDFFTGLGFETTKRDTKQVPASGEGTIVLIRLKKAFDPFKLPPERLREWSELPMHVPEQRRVKG